MGEFFEGKSESEPLWELTDCKYGDFKCMKGRLMEKKVCKEDDGDCWKNFLSKHRPCKGDDMWCWAGFFKFTGMKSGKSLGEQTGCAYRDFRCMDNVLTESGTCKD